jgi:hypothetical protein
VTVTAFPLGQHGDHVSLYHARTAGSILIRFTRFGFVLGRMMKTFLIILASSRNL